MFLLIPGISDLWLNTMITESKHFLAAVMYWRNHSMI
jgi:hypothetical protein